MKKTFPPAPKTTQHGYALTESYNIHEDTAKIVPLDAEERETKPDFWRDDFETFVDACSSRLKAGAEEYGNQSFSEDPDTLLEEIQQELLDTACWSFIMYRKLKSISRVVGDLAAE